MDDIELAGKYGLIHQIDGNFGKELMVINEKKIKVFAAQIRADERERCASEADNWRYGSDAASKIRGLK